MGKADRRSHVEAYRGHVIYAMLAQRDAEECWALDLQVRCPDGTWFKYPGKPRTFENPLAGFATGVELGQAFVDSVLD